MTLNSLLADIRSCIWFVRLLRRVSNKSLARDQWFVGASDADVRWLAEEDVSKTKDFNDARYLILEAKREFLRRGSP